MNTVLAIAGVVIKELYRRKDVYVLVVLTAVLTGMMATMNFFGDASIVRYLKSGCLLLIWVSMLVVAIVTTARQIPAELENRTIFPLLAKPVTRFQVIAGKFLGCWLACGIALLVFYTLFGALSSLRESHWPSADLLKAMWLHWTMLGVVAGLALLGSVVFSAPSANSTICFVVVVGILLLGRYLNGFAITQPQPLGTVTYALYFLFPHLEWYDQRDQVVNGQTIAGWNYCGLATLYALFYIALLLHATWLMFRRKPLNA